MLRSWLIEGGRRWSTIAFICLALGSCLISNHGCAPAMRTYSYRAVTDDCNCEEFRIRDRHHDVVYLFRAKYRMDRGIVTEITVRFFNNTGKDTLSLERASVKVASRNVGYQYNNRFLPLPDLEIPPGRNDVVNLTGRDTDARDDWNKIAGERLVITLRGLRIGGADLQEQSVTFIPFNPKLRN